jgi:hypothetical protein
MFVGFSLKLFIIGWLGGFRTRPYMPVGLLVRLLMQY